ncbi:MAG: response regulator transcription factor [Bacteroidales bacterium]|jgi:DNA-binding response OmpR family regulator|nr:response regulator transcription factor [Bacteroidales bacterium]
MIVESSLNMRSVLKKFFENLKYKVLVFEDGESAIRGFKRVKCDICLMEVDLPGKDGYRVLVELRNMNPDFPVIIFTANDSKEDKIKGFTAECDDYVTKPFCIEELQFRMETVLKRCSKPSRYQMLLTPDIVYFFGDFIFNYSEMRLTRGDTVQPLTRREAQLLRILSENMNRLVPREVMSREIWGDSKTAKGRSLDVYISKIRAYLKTEKEETKNLLKVDIISVHGLGYLLKVINIGNKPYYCKSLTSPLS